MPEVSRFRERRRARRGRTRESKVNTRSPPLTKEPSRHSRATSVNVNPGIFVLIRAQHRRQSPTPQEQGSMPKTLMKEGENAPGDTQGPLLSKRSHPAMAARPDRRYPRRSVPESLDNLVHVLGGLLEGLAAVFRLEPGKGLRAKAKARMHAYTSGERMAATNWSVRAACHEQAQKFPVLLERVVSLIACQVRPIYTARLPFASRCGHRTPVLSRDSTPPSRTSLSSSMAFPIARRQAARCAPVLLKPQSGPSKLSHKYGKGRGEGAGKEEKNHRQNRLL